MQAQAINFTQQIFQIVTQFGPINAAAIAKKLNSSAAVVHRAVSKIVSRGYVKRHVDVSGHTVFTAAVAASQATFYTKRKAGKTTPVAYRPVATPVTKAQIVPAQNSTRVAEVFNYIADNARPSLNPTEVHDAFQEVTYNAISSIMWKLVKRGYLINNDGQYSLGIKKEDAVFGNSGRPAGSFKNTIKVNGKEIKIRAKEALRLYKQLNKHYG